MEELLERAKRMYECGALRVVFEDFEPNVEGITIEKNESEIASFKSCANLFSSSTTRIFAPFIFSIFSSNKLFLNDSLQDRFLQKISTIELNSVDWTIGLTIILSTESSSILFKRNKQIAL